MLVALLATLLAACRAGPPPGSIRPVPEGGPLDLGGLAAREEPLPASWTEALDEALFGAPAQGDTAAVPDEPVRRRAPPRPEPPRPDYGASLPGAGPPEAARSSGSPSPGTAAPSAERESLSPDTRALLSRGQERLLARDLPGAAAVFEEGLAGAPAQERWIFQRALADACVGLGLEPRATALYEALLAEGRHPRSSTLAANLALALLRLGRLEEARRRVQEALAIDPRDPEALKTLGLLEARSGEEEPARNHLAQALGLKPDIPEALLALAELDAARGDRAAAIRRLRRLETLESATRSGDIHGRWRRLFPGSERSVAEELRERRLALESESRAEKAGATQNEQDEKPDESQGERRSAVRP